jgi:hypothetical protein
VFRGDLEKEIDFDEITRTELTLGFIRLIQDRQDKETRRGDTPAVSRAMLDFMELWTDDSASYVWAVVVGYVNLVFIALEQGRFKWTDSDKIERIRLRATGKGETLTQAAKSTTQSAAATAAAKPKAATRWYADYQTGKCSEDSLTHNTSRGQVSHICKSCHRQGKELNHPDSKCRNKVRSSKNT